MKSAFLYVALIIVCWGTNIQGAETIWAVGGGAILRNDDGVWQTVSLPDSIVEGRWRGVWGSASNDVYFTGLITICPPPFGPFEYRKLLHYDGADWRTVVLPGESGGPPAGDYQSLGIDGTGASNIYLVGGWWNEFSATGYMIHFDGSAWSMSEFPHDQPQLSLSRVWADPAGGFYATGECWDHLHFREYHAVYHYLPPDQWIKENPRSGDDYFEYDDISGFGGDLVSVPGMIYANYELSGNVIHAKSAGDWYKLGREDSCGNFYHQYPHCPLWPTRYRGVWCASPTDIWSCGDGGSVLHWTPTGYMEFGTPTTARLNAIWGTSNADVYAVGNGGAIVHYDGTDWSLMESGTTQNLYDIYGTPAPATATLLQSSSIDARATHVTVRWTLSEYDEGAGFRFSRKRISGASTRVIDDDPEIERTGLTFAYTDRDVEPGESYAYRVEYSSEGAWRFLFETEAVRVPSAALALNTNYPNPFNPSTTISYSIPAGGRVTLRIYDAAGRLVRRLLDTEKPAGAYSTRWDGVDDRGRAVASGAYFCRMEFGKTSMSRKIMLMR